MTPSFPTATLRPQEAAELELKAFKTQVNATLRTVHALGDILEEEAGPVHAALLNIDKFITAVQRHGGGHGTAPSLEDCQNFADTLAFLACVVSPLARLSRGGMMVVESMGQTIKRSTNAMCKPHKVMRG